MPTVRREFVARPDRRARSALRGRRAFKVPLDREDRRAPMVRLALGARSDPRARLARLAQWARKARRDQKDLEGLKAGLAYEDLTDHRVNRAYRV